MSDDAETSYIVYWLSDAKTGGGYRALIYKKLENAIEAAKSYAHGNPGTMYHIAGHRKTFLAENVIVLKEVQDDISVYDWISGDYTLHYTRRDPSRRSRQNRIYAVDDHRVAHHMVGPVVS